MEIKKVQGEIHRYAREKGWYEEERNIPEMLALIHSEVSEALEEYRDPRYKPTGFNEYGPLETLIYDTVRVGATNGNGGNIIHPVCIGKDKDHNYDPEGKPEGFPVELADAVIRILDLAEYLSIDMEQAIRIKMAYNKTRSYRHGNKKA